ncbi:hypothetical protein EG829_06655, partial [bacterium]|nr:hypothetical protein [bacterium]
TARHPPTAHVITKPANQTSAENAAVSIQIQAADANGDSLTYSATGLPTGLNINSSSGLITGTVSYCTAGTYTVTVTAKDPGNLTDSTTFTWTVAKTNVDPVVTKPANQTTNLNGSASLQIQATDANCGDSLSFSVMGLPDGLSISSTGLIAGTATVAGTFNPTVTVSDGTASASTSFSWTVNTQAVNEPPVIVSSPVLVAERDKSYRYDVNATDPNNDVLTYRLVTRPSGMSISSTTGLITWTPNETGSYSVTVEVTDAKGLKATQSYSLRVRSTDYAPTVTNPGNQTSYEESAVSLQIKASDSNGDKIFYSATGLPAGLTINETTGLISGTIAAGAAANSSYAVTVTATDTLKSSSTSFSWTVKTRMPNTAPVIASTPVTTATAGSAYTYDVNATDIDGDTLSYSLITAPSGMSINSSTGVISWTPTISQTGSNSVAVQVSDGNGGTDSQSFTVTVASAPVNNNPTITSTPVTVATAGNAYTYDVNATDSDSDTLSYSLTSSPSGMAINSSTGVITWIPTTSQTGSRSVVVEVSDGKGGTDSQSFTVTVTGSTTSNGAPIFTSTPVTSAVSRKYYSYDVNAVDPDGDSIKYALSKRPDGMIINSSTGMINWYAYRTGSYQISVKATDSKGNSAYQNFTITVASTSAAASVLSVDVDPAGGVASDFTANPCDVSGDGLVTVDDVKMIIAGRGTDDLTLDIDGDGMVTLLDSRVCASQMQN